MILTVMKGTVGALGIPRNCGRCFEFMASKRQLNILVQRKKVLLFFSHPQAFLHT